MPDGKTHETINAAALIASLAGLYHISAGYGNAVIGSYLDTHTILVFSLAYLFATFFLSPDLDTQSRPYKRWRMFRILWWPYRIIFKHRGFSHNLILGPLSIMMNLALITIPLLLLAGVELQNIPPGFILAAIMGIVLSMEIHIISDRLISKMKSWF
jgi:uncharacterized metal-binding protein